ncbi:MAG: hypothetical protein NTU51_08190 [Bacteroidetes bacterium]|nr:hypothetical protein [Bacteroidota bacterium]
MRTSEPFKIRLNHINSLEDLQREKEKLQMEIVRREEGIKYNYQNLVHLLSFKNLLGTLIDDVSTTTSVIGKIVSISKDFLARRKKKKKVKQEQQSKQEAGDAEPAE